MFYDKCATLGFMHDALVVYTQQVSIMYDLTLDDGNLQRSEVVYLTSLSQPLAFAVGKPESCHFHEFQRFADLAVFSYVLLFTLPLERKRGDSSKTGSERLRTCLVS